MTVSNFGTGANEQISGTFRNGSNATLTAETGNANFTANGTVTRQYTVTGSETSIGLRTFRQGGTTKGTIAFAATCTPATPPTPTISSIAPTGGSSGGGTPVTITGTNFVSTNTYSATFGGSTVPATYASATTLTATTPAGNGSVTVSVTDTTRNLAASGAATFVYAAPSVTGLSVTSGPANQARAVTITGTNFTPTATVSIDGQAATAVTFVSATQLTATLPGRPAGSYSVRVATGAVTTAANPPADQYTYIAAPALTSLTPNSGTTAGGTSVTITGTNLTGATAVTFGGSAAQSYVVNSATQITAVTPARSAGSTDIAATTPGGTATLVGGFTYVSLVAPSVQTQPANQTVAVGATATFTTAASGSPSPTLQWQISTDGGASFTDISGATGLSYTTPATSASDNGNRYRVIVSNSQGTATSVAAILTVVQAPTANAQSVSVGFNTATPITLTGTDPNTPARTLSYLVVTNPAHGTLSGTAPNLTYTPTTNYTGADSFAFTVSNGVATSSPATVSLTVSRGSQTITFTSTAPGAATVGGATYAVSASASSGLPVVFSSTTPGVCTLSGATVSFVGTGTCTIAADQGGSATFDPAPRATQSFTVAPAAIAVAPPSLPGGTVGVAYSLTFTASGGSGGFSYAVTAGAIPAGMALASDGRFSGTPTAGGSFTFTVTATDSASGTGSRAYTFAVASANVFVEPLTLPAANRGVSYSQTLTASGGTAPYSYAVTAGALPSGVTLSSAGVLSGQPATNGSFTFTVTVTDSSTGTGPFAGQRPYTLSVTEPAPAPAPGVTGLTPNTGPASGGTVVTITGTNLTGATGVTFGAIAATSFTVVSNTQITATAPAGLSGSTVAVTVTTPSGPSASTGAGSFTYASAPPITPAPIPTLTEWAMMLLAALLAGGAAIHLHRRRPGEI